MESVNLKPHKPELLWAAIESAAWLSIVALATLAGVLGELSVRGASLLCILMMLGLIWSAWKNFEGGRHPCFLFLGMLFIFQCGMLPGFWTGVPRHPFMVFGLVPFTVSNTSKEITLLLIVLSGVCVYTACRLTYRRAVFQPGPEQRWLRPLYVLLAVTLPFSAYKNYLYLSFVRSHGGYMAIYTEGPELLHSAGLLVRTVSLLGTTALMLLYTFERRPERLKLLLVLFFVISSMDLLIGLRGKFFVEVLVLWYIRNLKTGKKFNLVPLLSAALVISVLAVAIAAFRQEKGIRAISPLGFLATQGVSMQVTELAVQNRNLFGKHSGRYLLNELLVVFLPGESELPGGNFDAALSYYINPVSANAGFGTGSSYLAEAYLFGGIIAVVIASLLTGLAMSWLHRCSSRWPGAVLVLASLGWIIYMPRAGLLVPISYSAKSLFVIVLVLLLLLPISALLKFLAMTCRGRFPGVQVNLRPTPEP